MAHNRKAIRDRIVTVCTGLTTTSTRVHKSRLYPLASGKLPALAIYALNESSEQATIGASKYHRLLDVAIDAMAEANANIDDTLDLICEEVETAIGADRTLNGLAKETILISTDIELSGDGEKPVGIARMIFRVTYRTSVSNATATA
jgi:hypothetical protein